MDVTSVFLVRHGRTTLNAEGRYRGLQDPPLDDVGLEDARAAGAWLAPIEPAAVYTSPLRRARETARAIAVDLTLAPQVLPPLIDLDHGQWTALTPTEAGSIDARAFARFRSDPSTSTPPGGEPLAGVERRMEDAIRWLATRHVGEPVTAVSHEIPIRLLLAAILDRPGAAMWDLEVSTGSITELRVSDGSIQVRTMPFAPARTS